MLFLRVLLVCLSCLWLTPAFGLDKITLQLKWLHQFQFAGYYAAKELGYYKEAGLDVTLEPSSDKKDPISNVLDGGAQYGVGSSDLMLLRNSGKPVVALAVIFQHSPYVLLALQKSGIESVHDLPGKRVMMDPSSAEIIAYIKKSGVSPESLVQIKSNNYEVDELTSGRADAYAGYSTNDPWFLNKAGVQYVAFTPRSEGIDFYGDNLFTTEAELDNHPERVEAFVEASLKGWRYAVHNPEKTVDFMISAGYVPVEERAKLIYEATKSAQLIHEDLIEIGHMNEDRWQDIADTYSSLGMLPKNYSLKGFVHEQKPQKISKRIVLLLVLLGLIAIVASVYAIKTYLHNRQLFTQFFKFRTGFEKIVSRVPGIVYQFRLRPDGTSSFPFASKSFKDVFGFDPAYVRDDAARVFAAVHPRDLMGLMNSIQKSASELSPWKHEMRLIAPGGGIRWLVGNAIPEMENDGSILWNGVITDVTETRQAELSLRKSEELLRDTQRVASIGSYINYLEEGTYECTPVLDRIFGISEDFPHTNAGWLKILHPDFLQSMNESLTNSIRNKKPFDAEYKIIRPSDGAERWMHGLGQIGYDDEGRAITLIGTVQDITERKEREENLRLSEIKLRKSQEIAGFGNYVTDLSSGHWYSTTSQLDAIFGIDDHFIHDIPHWNSLLAPEYRQLALDHYLEVVRERKDFRMDYQIIRPLDGERRWIAANGELEYDNEGRPIRLIGTIQDITERKMFELQLERSNAHLIHVREEEKARVAREIHDELGGILSAIKIDLYWMERKLPHDDESAIQIAQIETISQMIDAATDATRRIISELRPAMLDDLGLLAAIEWQASQFSKRTKIETCVICDQDEGDLDNERSIAIFRILQEALTNVSRHSGATLVEIEYCHNADGASLRVHDNGQGVIEKPGDGIYHFGLRGMHERAAPLGGSVSIESKQDSGVTINAIFPLKHLQETGRS